MRSPHKLRTLFSVVREYDNWSEILVALARRQQPHRVILRNGTRIFGPEQSPLFAMAHEIFVKQCYTPPELSIGPDDLVVDIGANVGVFALFSAARTRNTIHAFEPLPSNFEFLVSNAGANGCSNVKPWCLALGDHRGTARLVVGGSLMTPSLIDSLDDPRLHRTFNVEVETLPHVMDDLHLDRIDFLKMDCEGAEGLIIGSTPDSYLRKITKMAIEYHDPLSPLKHDEIRHRLEHAGFKVGLELKIDPACGYIYARKA